MNVGDVKGASVTEKEGLTEQFKKENPLEWVRMEEEVVKKMLYE